MRVIMGRCSIDMTAPLFWAIYVRIHDIELRMKKGVFSNNIEELDGQVDLDINSMGRIFFIFAKDFS